MTFPTMKPPLREMSDWSQSVEWVSDVVVNWEDLLKP
jgi:hypothetical protein